MITFRAQGWSEEGLAKRLAYMLVGNDQVWYLTDEKKWQLGAGNNFWLRSEGDSMFRLSFRLWTPERIDALIVMLEWRLGGVRVERKDEVSS